eukprot:4777422-Pleurochrysis_carterae.AAC.2
MPNRYEKRNWRRESNRIARLGKAEYRRRTEQGSIKVKFDTYVKTSRTKHTVNNRRGVDNRVQARAERQAVNETVFEKAGETGKKGGKVWQEMR